MIVFANISTCILYPAHTILSYNKTHKYYEEPQYIIDAREMVNPYDDEDAPLFHAFYNLGIFCMKLSDMEIALVSFEFIFIVNICINFFL